MRDDLYYHGLMGSVAAAAARASAAWVRNPSWLALPAVLNTDQKFVGVHAVWPNANFCALNVTGNYTVDWGDGSAPENIAAGVQANHEYDYTAAALANTNAPVTLTDAGDLVGRVAHGYVNGAQVRFYNIAGTTGLSENVPYYVINANANDFQVSLTVGGAAVALTTNGSATLLPYKQAIVTVTMQAGQNMTALNLFVKHNQTGLVGRYASGWLDIAMGSPNFAANGLVLSGNSTTIVRHDWLQKVSVLNFGGQTTLNSFFQNCPALRTVALASTASVVSMNHLFDGCSSLITVPLFDTSAATDLSYMFNTCYSLVSIPLFNTALNTNMTSMFNSCYSLVTVPLLNTASVTNMFAAFANCLSLLAVPQFNTASLLSMNSTFQSCYSLPTVPLFNTALVANMNSMFQNCYSLTSVPLFDMKAVTTAQYMFNNCYALAAVPLFDTRKLQIAYGMFYYCRSLTAAPALNTATVTDMSYMFAECLTLTYVPLLNTALVTSMSNMFANCMALDSIPMFNTAAVTDMSSMFQGCLKLAAIPLLNTALVTNMGSMFQSCLALTEVPALSMASIIAGGAASMFATCPQLSGIKITGMKFSFSVVSCKLSAARLNEIYTNLVAAAGQTITVTGNYGTTTDDTTIATGKGWTVTG